MELNAELVFELTVEVGEVLEVGKIHEGFLRVIPITGGTFSGPNIKGKVIPGGADWNTRVDDKVSHVFAKYCIQTDDGEFITVENEGFNDLTKPQPFIRTTPRFQVREDSKYDWLNSGVFVGSLKTSTSVKSGVDIKIYKMK